MSCFVANRWNRAITAPSNSVPGNTDSFITQFKMVMNETFSWLTIMLYVLVNDVHVIYFLAIIIDYPFFVLIFSIYRKGVKGMD